MSKKETELFIPYGIGHTKRYTKSIVCDYLVDTSDDDDKVVKINNDVNLLLRQKTLHRVIGVDLLRDYVNNLQRDLPEQYNFTDDELFQLIEPKSINNLTTGFQYAKYIQSNGESIRKKFDELKTYKKNYDNYLNRYNLKD